MDRSEQARRQGTQLKICDIQTLAVCKWHFVSIAVLTYFMYAPLRFSQNSIFAKPESESHQILQCPSIEENKGAFLTPLYYMEVM
ncbi:hypothetical protein [Brucella thiophenivorans]|uniref:hypothetical protein n=1 Tax=Brucella thiophenivorans TaxID=571255 RepID=UPI00117C61B7|nr:hypothetical protein [Brucella thiophenivorans]